jgi:hypothetical protein
MRRLMVMSGWAALLASSAVAVDLGQPGNMCPDGNCADTRMMDPQPIATMPVPVEAPATARFTPPVPVVTMVSVIQATPDMHEAMPGMSMGGDTQAPSSKALMEANAKMHAGMNGPFIGDADVDFVRAMIAHHQGAIDMAKMVIVHGKDPDIKMLANDIMKAQGKEIDLMTNWLALHGPKPKVEAPRVAKPRPPVVEAKAKPITDLLQDSAQPKESAAPVTAIVSASAPATGAAVPPAGTDMEMPLLEDMGPEKE